MAVCRMSSMIPPHVPVLLQEVTNYLVTHTSGIYVDATFGRGSHSNEILSKLTKNGRLLAFDKDKEAYLYAKQNINDHRFSIFHASFADLGKVLDRENLKGKVTGILFDLGISSPQVDNPDRGFSFMRAGKLDMRMNRTEGIDAATYLQNVSLEELSDVLWKYGEERYAKRIAKAIVSERKVQPITDTLQLADIIKKAVGSFARGDKHPATKSFQAIRIVVNRELEELSSALEQAIEYLCIGGRLAVISFHSLEDRLVKQFIRQHEKGLALPRGLPIKHEQFTGRLKSIVRMMKPSFQEINENPRARSAILRIAEKIS